MTYAWGITGARHLPPGAAHLVSGAIAALPDGVTVITGACRGVDAYAARVAYERGLHVITIVPANRALVDPDCVQWCHEIIEMPEGSTYRDRNQAIVDRSQALLAFPQLHGDDQRSRRSGTWQTIRIARKAVIPVVINVLSEANQPRRVHA
jgi:NAD(P)-dependent dehydrogenase (short-subunit alcohol dehydrogenase family)